MASGKATPSLKPSSHSGLFLTLIVLLVLVLGFLFAASFRGGMTLFSNDSPLGVHHADYFKSPEGFTGVWHDLNWLGANGGSFLPSFTYLMFYVLGPIGFSKFHAPVALLFCGVCGWWACRALGMNRPVALLVGIAASLNMNVFSNACWGLSSRPLALGTSFLAVAAVASAVRFTGVRSWMCCALAGLAVGMGITEGADIGVIFSLFLGAFALVYLMVQRPRSASTLALGFVQTGVIVVFAGVMAFHIFDALVFKARVLDAAVAGSDSRSPREQYNWATQWSLPKVESLRVIIPGLHGYRMDTPNGGRYWGWAGRDPDWDEARKQYWEKTGMGWPRYSGAGEYAGVTVVLMAAFALAQSFRRKDGVLSDGERRMVWFWAAAAVVSLAFAWGRFAPFYKLIFSLPYFSNFRNPIKWTHPLHLSLLMMFGYGLQALWRGYLEKGMTEMSWEKWRQWMSKAAAFDRRWVFGVVGLMGVSVLFSLVYITSTNDLVKHLANDAVAQRGEDPYAVARQVASFSQREVMWFLFYLGISVGILLLGVSRMLGGSRAGWAAGLLATVLVVDLSRANAPWIIHYDYKEKYESNAVIDFLQQQTQKEHQRVAMLPFAMSEQMQLLQQIYRGYWSQHEFMYYNIPSIDVVQDPRAAAENMLFRRVLGETNAMMLPRLWELTSTRYLFGVAGGFIEQLDQQLDGGRGRFKPALLFAPTQPSVQKVGAQRTTEGPMALIEFTGALPRATLFTQWRWFTNDIELLNQLAETNFVSRREVLISAQHMKSPPPKPVAAGADSVPVTATITSYAPKRIVVSTDSAASGILMLTDKFDPDWVVTVDGQSAELLQCNFLMRGVQVPPGKHVVEFQFKPSTFAFWVSIAAILLGLGMLGFVWLGRGPQDAPSQP